GDSEGLRACRRGAASRNGRRGIAGRTPSDPGTATSFAIGFLPFENSQRWTTVGAHGAAYPRGSSACIPTRARRVPTVQHTHVGSVHSHVGPAGLTVQHTHVGPVHSHAGPAVPTVQHTHVGSVHSNAGPAGLTVQHTHVGP